MRPKNQKLQFKSTIDNQKSYSKVKINPLKQKCFNMDDFIVVGMKYQNRYKFTNDDKITFQFEPTNEYDPNAIKILANGRHEGYVSERNCAMIREIINKNNYNVVPCEQYENSTRMTITYWLNNQN